jgi:hypothetical protein
LNRASIARESHNKRECVVGRLGLWAQARRCRSQVANRLRCESSQRQVGEIIVIGVDE